MSLNIFSDITQDWVKAADKRGDNAAFKFKYGIKFLDDAMGGIRLNSLIVITGRTGCGKTAMAEIIADANRSECSSVFSLFLEAEEGEIFNRKLYREFAHRYYAQQTFVKKEQINYRDFYDGLYDKKYSELMQQCEFDIVKKNKNFNIYYRCVLGFGLEELESMIDNHIPRDKPTLFIIDHIHHFDWEDTNDVAAIKRITKKIRDASLLEGLAVIMFAHIRKSDRKNKTIIPDVEDIHGSSEIYKEATQCISLAPYRKGESAKHKMPTLFRISKDRLGALYQYIGLNYFDIRTQSYDSNYEIKKTNFEETELMDLDSSECPDWFMKEEPQPIKKEEIQDELIKPVEGVEEVIPF